MGVRTRRGAWTTTDTVAAKAKAKTSGKSKGKMIEKVQASSSSSEITLKRKRVASNVNSKSGKKKGKDVNRTANMSVPFNPIDGAAGIELWISDAVESKATLLRDWERKGGRVQTEIDEPNEEYLQHYIANDDDPIRADARALGLTFVRPKWLDHVLSRSKLFPPNQSFLCGAKTTKEYQTQKRSRTKRNVNSSNGVEKAATVELLKNGSPENGQPRQGTNVEASKQAVKVLSKRTPNPDPTPPRKVRNPWSSPDKPSPFPVNRRKIQENPRIILNSESENNVEAMNAIVERKSKNAQTVKHPGPSPSRNSGRVINPWKLGGIASPLPTSQKTHNPWKLPGPTPASASSHVRVRNPQGNVVLHENESSADLRKPATAETKERVEESAVDVQSFENESPARTMPLRERNVPDTLPKRTWGTGEDKMIRVAIELRRNGDLNNLKKIYKLLSLKRSESECEAREEELQNEV